MRTRDRTLLTALIAALLLALGVTSASARRLEISNTRFRIVWPTLELAGPSSEIRIRCPVTLEGTLHSRTISKVSGQLIGYVTRAIVNTPACAGSGNFRFNAASLPWHIRYGFFAGSLPTIAEIHIQLIGIKIEAFIAIFEGFNCNYTSTPANPVILTLKRTIEAGEIFSVRREGRIPTESGFPCPLGIVEGFGNMTVLGSTTKIFVRLVA